MKLENERKFEKLFYISARNRRTGYTTMMLRAAMYQPNCIIIAHNRQIAKHTELQYDILYNKIFNPKNIFKRLYIKSLIWLTILNKPSEKPKFLTLDSELRGYNKPILFDNSCFLY